MGKIEQLVQKQERWGKIEKALIATIVISGVLITAAVAPNVVQLFGKVGMGKRKSLYQSEIKSSLSRLKNKGALRFVEKNGKYFFEVTEKGRNILARSAEYRHIVFRKPRRWDKKWRVIIFDVPERMRARREKLRSTLLSSGFYRLQNSVWVYPYDCEDFITLLKTEYGISQQVLYLLVSAVEDDKKLRNVFGLK
jgi:DNA-binding transcriptional regulator PaaX